MIFVAGGGFYGTKAVLTLKNRDVIIVADVDSNCRAREYVECVVDSVDKALESRCGLALVVDDAAKVFINLLVKGFIPDIVVPATPRHFAGDVFKRFLELNGFVVRLYANGIDRAVEALRKHGVEVQADYSIGIVISSYMPFTLRCTPRCREPPVCPVTKKIKPVALHKLIGLVFSGIADKVFVLESRLLDDEIGGFSGYELFDIMASFTRYSYRSSVIIATACKCHGVANMFYCIKG